VISFLRVVGLMNAAVWLGGSLYHLLAVGPFFSSAGIKWLIGDFYAGGVGLMAWQRFYALSYLCISVALLHLVAEWVYLGRGISRFNGGLLCLLLTFTLLGNYQMDKVVAPAYYNRTSQKVSAEERARAERTYPLWSTIWNTSTVLLELGILIFSIRTLTVVQGPRFTTQTKFRTPDSLEP
jgi:hypothetical protein